MAATFSENIAAALRQIALDQIAQDLEIQQTYATKDELNNLGGVAAKRLLPSNRWSSFTTATWPHRLTTETI